MGLFQNFPYTNFHEINLDQIIKIMQDMQDEWASVKNNWDSMQEFINNYFDNLDVSEEVLSALQKMADSGELSTIIDPVIVNQTSAWLASHITPTTPAVDNTLSIAGAAADAKTTGDTVADLKEDLNNLKTSQLGVPNSIKLSDYTIYSGRISSAGAIAPTSKGYYTNIIKFPTTKVTGIVEETDGILFLAEYNGTVWVQNLLLNNRTVNVNPEYNYRVSCYIDENIYPNPNKYTIKYNIILLDNIGSSIKETASNIKNSVLKGSFDTNYSVYNLERGIIYSDGVTDWDSHGGWRTTDYIEFNTPAITFYYSNLETNPNTVVWLYKYNKTTHEFIRPTTPYIPNGSQIDLDSSYVYRICLLDSVDQTITPNAEGLTITEDITTNDAIVEYLNLNSDRLVSNLTPTATWIDDNNGSPTHISNLNSLISELSATGNSMKLTLSVDCDQFNNYANYEQDLLTLQENGCHIANHGNTWQDWIDHWETGANYNPDICEKTVIKGNMKLLEIGALEPNYFIYPGGHTDVELNKRAGKWCKCGVLAGYSDGICHLYGDGRMELKRCFIRVQPGVDADANAALTRIKGYIDTSVENNDWIIFGTHSGTTSEFDHDLFIGVMQYAISKGITFKTLNEAYKEREWMFRLYDILHS